MWHNGNTQLSTFYWHKRIWKSCLKLFKKYLKFCSFKYVNSMCQCYIRNQIREEIVILIHLYQTANQKTWKPLKRFSLLKRHHQTYFLKELEIKAYTSKCTNIFHLSRCFFNKKNLHFLKNMFLFLIYKYMYICFYYIYIYIHIYIYIIEWSKDNTIRLSII